jgi:hypothetical protein
LQSRRYLVEYHKWEASERNFPWKTENHEPSLSVEEIITKSRSSREKSRQELEELTSRLNHSVLNATFNNVAL